MAFQLWEGIVTGRNHILDGRNCQDALYSMTFELDDKQYIVGVIADGCGASKHSEVGAQMAVQFVPYALRHMIQRKAAMDDIPMLLFARLVAFLKGVVDGYDFVDMSEYVKFVQEHLLFTVIGFVTAPEETLVFAAGDGIVLINESRYIREQDNRPMYIGYQLLEQNFLQAQAEVLPYASGFEVYNVPSHELVRLAIGSDAWIAEQELLDEIWGIKTKAGLQLQMNRWSNARHLKDDASLIVVERELSREREAGDGC